MSYGRTPTDAAPQGQVVKAATFFPIEWYRQRMMNPNPIYPVGHELSVVQINRGEPCFTEINFYASDERVPVFSALNGIGFESHDYENIDATVRDPIKRQIKLMHQTFRFVGLAQKDVPASALSTMVDGPVLKKAGQATFTWKGKDPVYEGTWLAYKFPDPRNLPKQVGYGDEGRIVAQLVPFNELDFFPNIDSIRTKHALHGQRQIDLDPNDPQDELYVALKHFVDQCRNKTFVEVLASTDAKNALNHFLAAVKMNTCDALERIVGRVSRGAAAGGQCDVIVCASPL